MNITNTLHESTLLANTYTGKTNFADLIHARYGHVSHKNKHVKSLYHHSKL